MTFLLMFLIISSLLFFVYFKVQQVRSTGPMAKRWYGTKGSITVGIFFISFAINSYLNLLSSVAAVIALLFFVYGIANLYFGLKQHKEIAPHAKKEAETMEKAATQRSN
ncbi:hypothetical protein CR203_12815 [Salipaludibacillus neizhouensis]|uniref:YtpI-like protein n=2 Tax=Salipaludibacillus neizhouensis TaxID=885475 RepID=A0A3A9KPU8_9BACI|nr:YtpI family protein [Salipaludibacillus neizhouensis]RKL66716.1 hypothetical protein CR203_12815 [Salipaludibacillus neizhouensis]